MGLLIDLKREWSEAMMGDLESDLRDFIAAHPVLGRLPERDRGNAAHCAAGHLLLSIRAQSVETLQKVN